MQNKFVCASFKLNMLLDEEGGSRRTIKNDILKANFAVIYHSREALALKTFEIHHAIAFND
jgi:hypothetical protein